MAKELNMTQKKNSSKKQSNKKDGKLEKNSSSNMVVEEEKVVETKKNTKNMEKKEKKKNNDKIISVVQKVDDNRKAILFGIVGFLLATLLFRCILWPDRIATLKDGTQPVAEIDGKVFTADDLYEDMKKYYSVNVLLNEIDNIILTKKYPETSEMTTEIKETADSYYSYYEQIQGYTKDAFLNAYGFDSEKDFLDELTLEYRRNKYYEDYVEKSFTDKQIEKFYNDEVFGDVDSEHILVKIDNTSEDGLSDDDAKKLANEIIEKLNKGTSWEDVIKEYKDKIVHEKLGYNAFNASLESSYLKECKDLEVGKYSKTPVLTSYGYHIVYKIDQKEKPSLKDIKDDILDKLVNDKLREEEEKNDSVLYNKSLISMREDAKLEFIDTKLGEEYKELINNFK